MMSPGLIPVLLWQQVEIVGVVSGEGNVSGWSHSFGIICTLPSVRWGSRNNCIILDSWYQ